MGSMMNFEAVHELTENDNFHTSIYESDYDGLLIARCNQNGKYPHQVTAILNGLDGKRSSAEIMNRQEERIQELERLCLEIGTRQADALADKIEDLISEFGDDPQAALECVAEYLSLRRHNASRRSADQ